jgi:hypothetical protein
MKSFEVNIPDARLTAEDLGNLALLRPGGDQQAAPTPRELKSHVALVDGFCSIIMGVRSDEERSITKIHALHCIHRS